MKTIKELKDFIKNELPETLILIDDGESIRNLDKVEIARRGNAAAIVLVAEPVD